MGRDKDKKQAKRATEPSSSKSPKSANSPHSSYNQRPSWRVSRIELVDPYGWHVLDLKMITYLKGKLAHFETMTWGEILIDAKKQNHSVKVESLASSAKKRLEETEQDDVDELVSLHLSGRQRVWGILDQGTLNLLWWDPEHQVCPSLMKHT
jgi:hypothetical protein